LRLCVAVSGVGVIGLGEMGLWLDSEQRVVSELGNPNLCQGEEEDQFRGKKKISFGSAITIVENEGVGGFVVSDDSLCCGAVGDAAMAVVTSTMEESRESVMLDIHPLAVIGEKEGSYSVSPNWVVERIKHLCHVTCEGFEDKLMALFIAIEASQPQSGVGIEIGMFGEL